ncbi:MAG: hypothetical protein EPO26_01700 [Chloroflexota bacterium]|nr:MAG: hypothetical protein EPO26_01700 [Chloroflexota bacterium]
MATPASSRFTFRLPNTRGGAIAIAAAIAVLGFALGASILFVIPALQARGLLGASRAGRVIDVRARLPIESIPTPVDARSEIWMTPTARITFPSESRRSELGRNAYTVIYDPARPTQRVLPFPAVQDAIGRPLVAPLAILGSYVDQRTPAPSLPDSRDVTQVTLLVAPTDTNVVSSCVLAAAGENLRAVSASGSATLEGCASGILRFEDGGGIAFAITYDRWPNYRTRSGYWFDGAVLGHTEIAIAAIDAS